MRQSEIMRQIAILDGAVYPETDGGHWRAIVEFFYGLGMEVGSHEVTSATITSRWIYRQYRTNIMTNLALANDDLIVIPRLPRKRARSGEMPYGYEERCRESPENISNLSHFDLFVHTAKIVFPFLVVASGYGKCSRCEGYDHMPDYGRHICQLCWRLLEERRRKQSGCVYVFEAVGMGFYKIGRTYDLRQRRKNLVALPFDIRLVQRIEVPDPVQLEALLHFRFRDKRVNGEWFKLNDNDLQEIAEIVGS